MKKLILLLSVLVLTLSSSCSSIKTSYKKEPSIFVDVGAVTYPNKDLEGNIEVITRVIYDDWQGITINNQNKNGAILVKIPEHKATDIQSVEVTIINNTENNFKGMIDTYFYVGNYEELYYSTDYLDNKLTYKFDYKKLINNLK